MSDILKTPSITGRQIVNMPTKRQAQTQSLDVLQRMHKEWKKKGMTG